MTSISTRPISNAPSPTVVGPPNSLYYGQRAVEVWLEGNSPGEFVEVSDRLVCVGVDRGSDATDDRATFRHVFDDESEPMRSGGALRTDYLSRAMESISPEKLLRVTVGHAAGDSSQILFEGYPLMRTAAWGANLQDHQEGVTFEAVGVLSRWDTDPEAQIIGRYVHGLFGDPKVGGAAIAFTEDNLRLLESQPCTFNENNEPNCAAEPIRVTVTAGGTTTTISVYVFAARHEDEQGVPGSTRQVQRWTMARALMYLLYFYGYKGYSAPTRPVRLSRAFGVLSADDLLSIQATGSQLPNQADDPLNISDLFMRAGLDAPNDLAVDRTSLRDALTVLAAAGDFHFNADYLSSGSPRVDLAVWVRGEGAKRKLFRQPPRSTVPSSDQLAQRLNTHTAVKITYDDRETRNTPLAVGGPTEYELTTELVPGWLPLDMLDNVDLTVQDAEQSARENWAALLPGFYIAASDPRAVYLMGNPGHVGVANVGRTWVLNEHGRYFAKDAANAELYARTVPPFDAARYEPFDFAAAGLQDVRLVVFSNVTEPLAPGKWARVPRPFYDTLTKRVDGTGPPFVEISFDSGSTWQNETRVQISSDEAAVTFITDSPLEIVPTRSFATVDNMWFAIIGGRFRVRVTATVRGDELAMVHRGSAARILPSSIDRSMAEVLDVPRFRYQLRTEAGSILSADPQPWRHEERIDLAAMEAWRRSVARSRADAKVAGEAVAAWIDTTIGLGDQIVQVAGVGLPVQMRSDSEPVYPQVLSVRYQLDGVQSTALSFGDLRHAPDLPEERELDA
jgi:hypothetical protein